VPTSTDFILNTTILAPATDEVEINVLENPNKVDEEEIEMEKNRDIPMPVYGVTPSTN